MVGSAMQGADTGPPPGFPICAGSVNDHVFRRCPVRRRHTVADDQTVRSGTDGHGRTVQHIPRQDHLGKLILKGALDHPLQGPRAEHRVIAFVTMAILFVIFLFLAPAWGSKIYEQDHIFRYYGLINSRKQVFYIFKGLAIGFGFTWLLFTTEYFLGWVTFQSPTTSFSRLIFEGALSGIGVGFAEELFFRGWLLYELERDYSWNTSGFIDAIAFAVLHFIKPLSEIIRTIVTFPALVLLGYILVVAKQAHRNLLGICIGLHGGLVWAYYIINVGEMVRYNDRVPVWVTGIDNNPIAGVMGLIFLSGLLLVIKDY